jgi:predicted peptidase
LRSGRTFIPNSANPYADLAQDKTEKSIWIVRGDEGTVFPVEVSRKMAAELRSVGVDVHYTELSGINQNSWDAAYPDAELISWLFRQEFRFIR